jgi:hypothetical protein
MTRAAAAGTFVAVAALLVPRAAFGQEPAVTATASALEVTVGEPFTVELAATGPAGTTWTFPAELSTDAVDLSTPASATAPDASPPPPDRHRYAASVFALGEAEVPAITVRYRLPDGTEGEASTAPITVRVESVLPKDAAEQTLADVRGPVSLGIGRAFWIGVALIAAVVLALAVWWWRRRRPRAAAAEPVPEQAPDLEAFAALDRLAADRLPERGEFRVFYIRLVDVAKRYLERRLGAPVLEMTSTEMVAFLREHPHGEPLASVARDLAGAADQVKFARGDGLAEEARRHLSAVRQLIGALEKALRPAPEQSKERVA